MRRHTRCGQKGKRSGTGSALVIVLCFVVLLTAVVLAMLTHSIYSGMISRASSSISKADLYGHGAIDQVLGDLKQEIVAGSIATNTAGGYVYRPLTNMVTTAVPYNAGPASYANSAPAGTTTTYATTVWNTMPNLVKESTRAVQFYPTSYDTVGGPARAAAVNSSTDVSRNGHYISPARWNKPLLLPKATVTLTTSATGGTTISDSGTGSDLTPTSAFVAPDWILTAADGTNPTSLDTSSSTATSNINPKSPKYVVGRYAYVIYNEGGLLDANVAGCFGSVTATLSKTQLAFLARRGPSAFADLTQLPGIADIATAESQTNRSQQIVDSLIAWRNAATVGNGVTFFPEFPTAKITSVTNYFNYLLGIPYNFMGTGNTATYTRSGSSQALSDRVFSGRQQMLSFFLNTVAKTTTNPSELPLMQDAMMYLGTFSRTLNQPSYWPDSTRPRVIGPASDGSSFTVSTGTGAGSYSVVGVSNGAYPYGGGNSAYGLDDVFNPSFRSIRVASTITGGRSDGTDLVQGDPLVKKRFALSRLMWLTYKGPSALLATSDNLFKQYQYIYTGSTAGSPPAWLTQLWNEGTAANIYAYFGLTWEAGPGTGGIGGWWVYNHGITSSGVPVLGSLSFPSAAAEAPPNYKDVVSAGREPDFFELLKAAVACGAVAKCIQTIGNTAYSETQDSTVTPQIMQLGANIIDGANPTQYPTHIIYTFKSGDVRSVYGAMDLPYYTALTPVAFIVTKASPAPPSAANDTPQASVTLSNAGLGALLEVPSVWNPYDVNGPAVPLGSGLTGLAPSNLRIALAAALPTLNSSLTLTSTSWPAATAATLPYYIRAYFYASGYSYDGNNGTGGSGGEYYKSQDSSGSNATFDANWSTESSAAMDFSNPAAGSTLYHEPTALIRKGVPDSNLACDPGSLLVASYPSGYITEAGSSSQYIGILAGTFPLRWTPNSYTYTVDGINISQNGWTVRMEYQPPGTSTWVPYVESYTNPEENAYVPLFEDGTVSGTGHGPYLLTPNAYSTSTGSIWNSNVNGGAGTDNPNSPDQTVSLDPRTQRWGYPWDVRNLPFIDGSSSLNLPTTDQTVTVQPSTQGYSGSHANSNGMLWSGVYEPTGGLTMGYKQQNLWSNPASYPNTSTDFYMDADAAVRRAMGAYVSGSSNGTGGSYVYTSATTVGLPLAGTISATTTSIAGTSAAPPNPATNQSQSRPIMLHRPYRSVAELGHVFSDTPFKNIDFFTPESGYSALLDVFCINEDYRPDAVAAGRVDLNTKQAPVIQALLNGVYRDEENNLTSPPAGAGSDLSAAEAITISQTLVKRTSVGGTNPNTLSVPTPGPQPLINIADLVGRWITGTAVGTTYSPTYSPSAPGGSTIPLPSPEPAPISGAASYDGFSADLSGLYATGSPTGSNSPSGSYNIIQRFREATMRALSDSGQAGTWNLLIDVVAQTGRYPSNTSGLSDFIVDGERRYWVHVSIDRGTGQIVDENIEPVNE